MTQNLPKRQEQIKKEMDHVRLMGIRSLDKGAMYESSYWTKRMVELVQEYVSTVLPPKPWAASKQPQKISERSWNAVSKSIALKGKDLIQKSKLFKNT